MTDKTVDGKPSSKVNIIFWAVGVIALLWNLMGVVAFISDMMKGDEALSLMSEAERALYNHNPWWHKAVYGVATFCGLFGSIALLMKKKLAVNLFFISLIAVVIQFLYSFFGTNAREVYGMGAALLPILIALYAVFLLYYSKKCDSNGWLS